jgi:arsenite methyltransferase
VAVSDIALKRPLPPELADDLMAYVGCIAGAIPIEAYRQGLVAAGLAHVQVIDSGADLNAYARVEGQSACCAPTTGGGSCCSPGADTLHNRLADLLRRYNVNDYAASVKVYAVKPSG